MTRLIDRNTTIPTRKSQIFSTAADNQDTVDIHVLQGEREMAAHNKSIGRFQLAGIPPSMRGIPQIEVSFDIDSNGILSVNAKDKATGKEQSIKIQASSGLDDSEIDRMVKDAETNADSDKAQRELVDAKNNAEALVYQTQKQLDENKDKIDEEMKSSMESKLAELKKASEGEDKAAIDQALEDLNKDLHAFSQKLYEDATAQQAEQAGAEAENAASGPAPDANEEDQPMDADFEVVDEKK